MDLNQFKWLNESAVRLEDGAIVIHATENSDFFSPDSQVEGQHNAPFYYTEVTGDFMLTVKVSLDFAYVYDSASVMMMVDSRNWAKACFERTDFGTHAAVTVVTKDGASDDANGCNIEADALWLKIVRVGDSFGMHYSLDGSRYDMTRFFMLHAPQTIKVGLMAQSPRGLGGDRRYEQLSIQNVTVQNVRAGI